MYLLNIDHHGMKKKILQLCFVKSHQNSSQLLNEIVIMQQLTSKDVIEHAYLIWRRKRLNKKDHSVTLFMFYFGMLNFDHKLQHAFYFDEWWIKQNLERYHVFVTDEDERIPVTNNAVEYLTSTSTSAPPPLPSSSSTPTTLSNTITTTYTTTTSNFNTSSTSASPPTSSIIFIFFRHLNARFPNCLQACLEQVGCEMSFDFLKPNFIFRFLETITYNSIHSLCYNCAIIIESLRLRRKVVFSRESDNLNRKIYRKMEKKSKKKLIYLLKEFKNFAIKD
ncbi:hypothetical protein BpHYR1_006097 [Brachionus plicatilis]|uniref:Uncharacterized protein n=1 Tax=Brachionus plicatilis TaxID=10195 RepID=A0A3M7SFC8_BRAPC|nr:hypothetical protein BpHYR1_006097 [Brachionus plicatilis]